MAETSRLKLHEELCEILESKWAYYQPPASIKMNYPCIRYRKTGVDTLKANDRNYRRVNQYELVVIYSDPDSDLSDRILDHFPMCRFDRRYVADNLYNDVLTLYY